MAGISERTALEKQVHVHGRPDRQTQSDFAAVDKLQDAMASRRKVSFCYFRYDAEKKRVARKDGATHVVTPVDLVYSDGSYYLVAYSDADSEIRNYRLDRMGQIRKTGEPSERNEAIRSYDPEEAARTVFGMYDGEHVLATLKAKAEVMNVVIDRFGRDVQSKAIDGGKAARITVAVKESPVFFGWLVVMGPDIEIEKPKALRDAYAEYLKGILEVYGE